MQATLKRLSEDRYRLKEYVAHIVARVFLKHAAESFAARRAQAEERRRRFTATLVIVMFQRTLTRPYGPNVHVRIQRRLRQHFTRHAAVTHPVVCGRAYDVLRAFLLDQGAVTDFADKMKAFHKAASSIADRFKSQVAARHARLKFMTARIQQERQRMVACLSDSNEKGFKQLAPLVEAIPERALDELVKTVYRYALAEQLEARKAHEAELAQLKRKNVADERGGYRHQFLNVQERVIWDLADV